jgi:hypothetical protein
LTNLIQIDESRIQDHLGQVVRGTVEETPNAMLEAEADRLCQAARDERADDRLDYRLAAHENQLSAGAIDA